MERALPLRAEAACSTERHCGHCLPRAATGVAVARVGRLRPARLLAREAGQAPIPNVGHALEEYFHKLRRRKGESMAEWCVRSHETYQRLRIAMSRVVRPPKGVQSAEA